MGNCSSCCSCCCCANKDETISNTSPSTITKQPTGSATLDDVGIPANQENDRQPNFPKENTVNQDDVIIVHSNKRHYQPYVMEGASSKETGNKDITVKDVEVGRATQTENHNLSVNRRSGVENTSFKKSHQHGKQSRTIIPTITQGDIGTIADAIPREQRIGSIIANDTNNEDTKQKKDLNRLRRSMSKKFNKLITDLENLKLPDKDPQIINRDLKLITKLINLSNLKQKLKVPPIPDMVDNKLYFLQKLDDETDEFQAIYHFFTQTNKSFYKIQKIERVVNHYLFLQYTFKYLEAGSRGIKLEEKLMFHGTARSNIDSICKHNFNWRRHGEKLGEKYGRGVNFASNAYYATHYGDTSYNKVMIVAKVLIGECCVGSKNTLVPRLPYDTTTNYNQQVFVKYDDNTFYPAYVVHYCGIDYKKNNKRDRRR